MFILFYDPSKSGAYGAQRLGRKAIERFTPEDLGPVGTHLGRPGRRTHRTDASGTRVIFDALRLWIGHTGYTARVETTRREADALLTGGLVTNNSGGYIVAVGKDGRVAVR